MKRALVQGLPLMDCGISLSTAAGQEVSGGVYLVKPTTRGTLIAVVDGLGHRVEAAGAARLVIATLEAHSDEGVIQLVRRCHERLKGTRGVVMTLAAFDGIENSLTWLGVGNIEGILLRASASSNPNPEMILLRPGVVGYRLPPLQAVITPVTSGDLLILTTDGIRNDFGRRFTEEDQPGQIAEYISSNFLKGPDDGLVLVARYLGPSE